MIYIDIELMRRFLSVTQEGSISGAAEKLYISQQALSKSMGKLEKEIGGKLLDTGPDGVKLTELGRNCYPVISNVVKKYDSSLEIMRAFVEKSEQNLTVLLEFRYFPYILPRDLFTKIGDMTVRSVAAKSRKQCVADISSGKYDLAIVMRPEDPSALRGLTYIPLKEEGYYVLVNSKSDLAKKERIDISDFRNEKIILPDSEYSFFQSFIDAALAEDFYPDFSCESLGLHHCLQKVADNEGVALSPELGDALNDYPDLVLRPLSDSDLRMELGVLARSDYQSHVVIRSYINALKIMMEDAAYNIRL